MSTTVTYKGSTLTTANNQTRVLKTAGKYLEDDITIADVTNGVTQDANGYIVLPSTGAGSGASWSWMGRNPSLVQRWTETRTFEELGFDEWTYSDSASATIRASQTLSPAIDTNLDDYDYLQVCKAFVHYEYGNWTPAVAVEVFSFCGIARYVAGYNGVNSYKTETPNTNATIYSASSTQMYYFNGSGTESSGAGSYGVYSSGVSGADSSGTYPNKRLILKTPVIYARGNSTYFSQTAFANTDMENSYYKLVCEIWRVDHSTNFLGQVYYQNVQTLNNGL